MEIYADDSLESQIPNISLFSQEKLQGKTSKTRECSYSHKYFRIVSISQLSSMILNFNIAHFIFRQKTT